MQIREQNVLARTIRDANFEVSVTNKISFPRYVVYSELDPFEYSVVSL